jgi:hypothetical protein
MKERVPKADWSVLDRRRFKRKKRKAQKPCLRTSGYKCLNNHHTECSKEECECECHAEEMK